MTKQITFEDWKSNWMRVENNELVLGVFDPHTFSAPKMVYRKHLEDIADLFNYFTKAYDPDSEILTATSELSAWLDTNHECDLGTFIEQLQNKFSKDSIKSKIMSMVEDNVDIYEASTAAQWLKLNTYVKNIMVANAIITLALPITFKYITSKQEKLGTRQVMNTMLLGIFESLLSIFPESLAASDYIRAAINDRVDKDYSRDGIFYEKNNLDIQKIKNSLYHGTIIDQIFKCSFGVKAVPFIDAVIYNGLKFIKLAKPTPKKLQVDSDDKSDQKDLL